MSRSSETSNRMRTTRSYIPEGTEGGNILNYRCENLKP
jgi:hypothetical protein